MAECVDFTLFRDNMEKLTGYTLFWAYEISNSEEYDLWPYPEITSMGPAEGMRLLSGELLRIFGHMTEAFEARQSLSSWFRGLGFRVLGFVAE